MSALNLKLFRAINGWPREWAPFLRFFSEAVNQNWFKVAMLVLVTGMLLRGVKSRITVLCALASVGLANASTDVWKNLLPEPRPFQEIADVILRAGTTQHPGTASAHAANMAAVATVFLVREKWWGTPWLVVAILTGFSRVYVGVHYPYQVFLGWTCGVLMACLVLLVQRFVSARWSGVRSGRDSPKNGEPSTPIPSA